MKKLGIFLLALACVCASCLTKIEENPLYALSGDVKVCYIAKSEFENAEVVRSGDLFFNYFDLEDASSDLEKSAIAVQFENDFDLEEVLTLLSASIVSVSEMDDMVVLCVFTKFGGETFEVGGITANCQIAVKEDKVVIGFPAIYTAF